MDYIKCPECGKIVNKKDNCPNCGFPFSGKEEIIDVKVCPECKIVIEGILSRCNNCGYPFDEKNDFEKLLKEAEQKAREQEIRALEAERKLKELQEEKECEKKLAEFNKKLEESKRRAIEAEKKLAELVEDKNVKQASERNHVDERVENMVCESEIEENYNTFTEEEVFDQIENDCKENVSIIEDEIQDNSERNIDIKNRFLENKQKFLFLGGTLLLILIGLFYFSFRGIPVKSVKLEYERASLEVGDFGEIKYTIIPSDATNKEVTWECSDESIVFVNEKGILVGKKEGSCEVTVKTKNGKTAVCEITVEPAGPDLQEIYSEYCSPSYASVAADGSYLSIDTEPDSSYRNYEKEAISSILAVNKELGIPDSVIQKMGSTRAIDGVQKQICGDIEVRWSYHPDSGLKVIYSLIE